MTVPSMTDTAEIQRLNNEINRRIRRARADLPRNEGHRLTNADIAKRLRRPKGTVDGWLGGTRTPRAGDIAALADVLGVTADYLLHGDEELTRRREDQATAVIDALTARVAELELLLGL